MDTVTISTKEYRRLLGVSATGKAPGKKIPKDFTDDAFGLLKKSFGKTASVAHVTKLRKSWR